MNYDRMIKIGAVAGVGLMIVGGVLWYRQSKRDQLLGSLPPRMLGSVQEAPVVSSYSDGNMRTEIRSSPNMPIEQRLATIQRKVRESIQDPEMRKLALQITKSCRARDKRCEAKAIYKWVKKNVRYTGDIAPVVWENGEVEGVDLYQSARRTVEFGGGDCLPQGTLLLVEGHKLVPIEDVIIGARIWGRDQWTTVKDVWQKGTLPVDRVLMNNGSSFLATGDHKVYVALCTRHANRDKSAPCACPISERSIERIRVSQLEPDMVLIQPEAIAFGTEEQDPRRAYIEGLYISDGYQSHDSDFDISGRDGHPKEAQKREVEAICKDLGLATTWFHKSIRVRDREWAERVALMGGRAIEKHALSINLNEPAARELLRGIMADSGANTHGAGRTFTTTSRELMLQVRVLQRMLGNSCSERYIVEHGGEGEHPIWRLGVRDNTRSDGKAVKLLRVKEIDRAVAERPVYDISTSDHYVYLPEADVVVSNCDDHSILNATLLSLNGIPAKLRVTAEQLLAEDSHIYTGAELPDFTALDTTIPNRSFGYEAPYARKKDFVA